jgi:alpha-1,2-glucosyltransferase
MMLLLSSVSLSTLPPLFFFSFLYYTDPGSLFFVLLMYMFHVNNYEWLASLFGAISLLYRQTNIVWIFLLAAHKSFTVLKAILLFKHIFFRLKVTKYFHL